MLSKNIHTTDVVIVGAGPVGLFAIFQAGMLEMKCHVVDALDYVGGQCVTLYPEKPIYDIPAYPVITAADLIEKLKQQIAPFDTVYHLGQQVTECQINNDVITITTSAQQTIHTKSLIIAAGCGAFKYKKPALDNIDEFEDKTVFYSVKDKNKFVNQKVVIAGGGDSAADWALLLSDIAEVIYLVHRRSNFRCAIHSLNQIKQLAERGKIQMVTPYQLAKLNGENGILKEVLVSNFDGATKTLPADYLLAFFGLAADLGPIHKWGLKTDLRRIEVNAITHETTVPGIYAIGDVASYPGKMKLIVTGFAEAATVMNHCYEKVFGKKLHFQYSTLKGILRS
ncbi:pyridine nucleotide-disulfide oxidoreductase family protein [Orientia chuto str. Dubai]|uniref:Ferredoxin--NADP reductase n=1 Tax=Orientia chuto str. Dubai TaxID=1359168 RepID=A0A0F3MKF2_9RICK|nr:NAD(P)/FAD-dependent oxidoreductase [Candidatus Orientia mediorientalis]KJV56116.1 pyridine nucleotide-disulfide oxidoreductase family protein [Orientia chuto str. Dubai]